MARTSQLELRKEEILGWTKKNMPRFTEGRKLDSGALFEAAQVKYPFLSKLELRQFYARFPLQVMKVAKGGSAKGGRKAAAARKAAGQAEAAPEPNRSQARSQRAQNGNGNGHHTPGADLVVQLIRDARNPNVDVIDLVAGADQYAERIRSAK